MKLPKGTGARTVEMDMEKETIRQILEHMDLKATALILTLASSGMRIGELLQIELEDINLESTPTSVTIRGEYTKSGEQRTTYITKEAKTTLIEWLKVRDQYIKSSINRNNGFVEKGIGNKKATDDNRVFPFSDAVVYQRWNNALNKTGLFSVDRVTGRTQLRIHQLRKYFRSQLAIGCPVDIVEALMGKYWKSSSITSLLNLAIWLISGNSMSIFYPHVLRVTAALYLAEKGLKEHSVALNHV